MVQNWRPHFKRHRVGPWFSRRRCNVAKNLTFGACLYNQIMRILVLVSCWAYHIKVCAFHCFSLCANACPIDTCPPVPVLSFSALCLAAFPQLLAFPPSPPTKKKEAEKWVGGKVWMESGADASPGVKRLVGSVMPWSGQDGVRVERGWSKDRARAARAQWRVEKVAQTWHQKRCICIQIACVLHRLEFATPCLFHFSTAASLLVRGWKDGGVKRNGKTARVK